MDPPEATPPLRRQTSRRRRNNPSSLYHYYCSTWQIILLLLALYSALSSVFLMERSTATSSNFLPNINDNLPSLSEVEEEKRRKNSIQTTVAQANNNDHIMIGQRETSLASSQQSKNTAPPVFLKNTKRSKAHWCFWRPHMGRPMAMLRDEFGYNEVADPTKGEDWDLIFGGYPNCGSKKFDFKMETGLNKFLNDRGWDTLQPHQIWFPCMGCKNSYCNKKELCLLMKEIDPSYCFSLPEDRNRLLEGMRQRHSSQQQQLWVLKEDSPDKHIHVGTGINFIKSETELPSNEDQNSGTYLVQPLVNHKMGEGIYQRRRHELRMYISVTSTSPLRVYTNSITGYFANAQIDDADPLDQCSAVIGRSHLMKSCHTNATFYEHRSFDKFAENVGITHSEKRIFIERTNELIGKVISQAQSTIQNHIVNKGITKSGASCFSFLRVDFAMTDAITPYIYEINEFPFANEKGYLGSVQEKAYRDLFLMMGLDREPMDALERSKYEMDHLGGWTPVVINDVLVQFNGSNFFPSTVDRSSVGKVGSGKTDMGVGKETNKNHGNDVQAPTQGAFESALNEVTQLISDERTKSSIGAERTRQDFNLTMWDKRTTGGLKDLDRIKLAAIYRNATSVFEWGLGESSFIAATVGVPRYTGIDSDPTWIKAARDSSPDHFRFHLGDIGPTGQWGRPDRSRLKKSYLNYQFEPLVSEKAFDVYYVDGRMRPACALVAFLHASTRGETEEEKSPIVIIHDYYHDKMSQNCSECRKFRWQYSYHRIEEVADLVDHSGAMLAVFKRKEGVTDQEIKALWQEMGLGDT